MLEGFGKARVGDRLAMRRTRLPKASTGAKEALTAELEKAQGPAEIPAPVQACDNRQQLREILKELHEKDVQGLLRSAASKSADGESRSNFSVLEARLGQPAYTQEQFTLQKGEAPHMDELCEDVNIHCRSAADDVAVDEAAGLRRSKLMANVDLYSTAMAGGLKAVAAAFWRSSEHLLGVGGAEEAAVRQRLPESILANREPYFQGEWRQQPYVPRPYQRLTQYEIGEERETLLWKLRTQKRGGCSGQHCSSAGAVARYSLEKEGFETECTCLASNIECDDTCGCHDLGTCLNRAVTGRATLQLDKDLKEINSWGMDCYTRRNIHDAVLESEAFGPYKRPDYNALVRQPDNVNPLGRGETLHHEVLPGQQQSKQEQSRVVQPHDGVNGAQLASASDPDSTHGPPAPPPRSGHMPISSDSPDPEAAVKDAVTEWVERRLMPAVSCQGAQGWNILNALTALKQQDEATGNMRSLRAAKALEQRVHEAGLDYFRLHPKGVGLMCTRAGGLPPLTFVEEYLGELHAPWRWFEIQDAIKKTSRDELPDFYNIVLERPKDDPAGYDALFIDAASKGSFASRMSHSCSPNCQAVVMACAGRLTIAVYTLRHIREEEELTFDYASVTESEKEFRDAICLCGTRLCRGSFLYFAGSRAFSQIMAAAHTMLHRQAALLKAGTEPLTSADRRRLEKHGLRECALGRHGTRERVPEWLEKWAALILEYVEEEEARLPNELLAVKPPLAFYTPASAAAEAKGVRDNRIQNVVITLDKVKMCLQKPDQPLGPPLRMLSDDAVQEHLWTGDKSIAKRVLRGASAQLSNAAVTRSLSIANSTADLRKALERYKGQFPHLQALGALVLQPVATGQEAKAKLVELAVELRRLDLEVGGGHTAAADMVYLYAMTQHWFTAERNYKGFSSPPVQLNMDDLDLDRTAAPDLDSEHAQPSRRDTCGHQPAVVAVVSSDEDVDITGSDVKGPSRLSLANGPSEPATNGMSIASLASSSSRKRSKPDSSSQPAPATQEQVETVYDPTASLSAERRGTLSLPDIESCYGGSRARYTQKDRDAVLDHISKRPDAMWKIGTLWSFRNEAKIYGSPMFDAVWAEFCPEAENRMPKVIQTLRSAATPFDKKRGGAAAGGRRQEHTLALAEEGSV
ncbi:hypothetical protein WJX72_010690 [[Myrmecia] bisecta]|uniref:SET domain-containing protein n=1 Tax=[Myrmecia] bisecta TaxID=41462 RepID=A0AAW1Q888_9CHLO